MNTYIHKELAAGRWSELTFLEQMANIGSDVERALNWKNRNNDDYTQKALARAFELLKLTVSDHKNHTAPRLRELCRLKETLLDYFYSDNRYSSSQRLWRNYFGAFAIAARRKK